MEEAVAVFFPSVHGDDAGELIALQCFPDEQLRSMVKVTSGIDDTPARNIIGASRYDENTSQSLLVNVSNPNFSGRSYGLALALADKIVRHGEIEGTGRVIATGLIEADGCGRVDKVDAFQTKLRFLLGEGKPGDVFVFPTANLLPDNSEQQQLFRKLKEKGISLLSIAHVSGGAGRLWHSFDGAVKSEADQNKNARAWNKRIAIAAAMLLAVVALVALITNKDTIQTLFVPALTKEAANQTTVHSVAPPVATLQDPEIVLDKRSEKGTEQQVPRVVAETKQQSPKPVEPTQQGKPTTEKKHWFIQSVDVPTDAY